MANTYSQMYVQIVFAVKFRQSLIEQEWEEELYKYISGIVSNKGQKLLCINGTSDHIHILINLKPSCNPSDLVREIKKSSTEFINAKQLAKSHFQWQEGFGIFTYSYKDIDAVIKYIQNQKHHHLTESFEKEYLEELKRHHVEYKTEYLYEWFN